MEGFVLFWNCGILSRQMSFLFWFLAFQCTGGNTQSSSLYSWSCRALTASSVSCGLPPSWLTTTPTTASLERRRLWTTWRKSHVGTSPSPGIWSDLSHYNITRPLKVTSRIHMHYHSIWSAPLALTIKKRGRICIWAFSVNPEILKCAVCDALIPVAEKLYFFPLFFFLGSFQFLMHLSRVYGSTVYHSTS